MFVAYNLCPSPNPIIISNPMSFFCVDTICHHAWRPVLSFQSKGVVLCHSSKPIKLMEYCKMKCRGQTDKFSSVGAKGESVHAYSMWHWELQAAMKSVPQAALVKTSTNIQNWSSKKSVSTSYYNVIHIVTGQFALNNISLINCIDIQIGFVAKIFLN